MHELAIVEALIEQVGREVENAGHHGPVQRVELSIGRLSGVSCPSLRFALKLLAPGTVIEKAEVAIVEPKAVCACRTCGAAVEIDDLVSACPQCGSSEISIAGGREMLLQSIDLED
jgi:hydrogenase nickel incorporation protein HypA/HybF